MEENKSSYPQDLNFIKDLLVKKNLPADQIVTEANGKLIYQLMTDYQASLFDMESAIIKSLTSDLTLDRATLENTCRELFTADSAVYVSPGDIKTLSAEALLTKLTVGNMPDQREFQTVQEIRKQTGLNDQVMNLLIYYLYVKNNGKPEPEDLLQTAKKWAYIGISTLDDAMIYTDRLDKLERLTDKGDYSLQQFCTEVSNQEFLEFIYVSQREREAVWEIQEDFDLEASAINVLIYYTLMQTDMTLPKPYMRAIANNWRKADVKTAKDAFQYTRFMKEQRNDTDTSGDPSLKQRITDAIEMGYTNEQLGHYVRSMVKV